MIKIKPGWRKKISIIATVVFFILIGFFPKSILFAYIYAKWHEFLINYTRNVLPPNPNLHFKLATVYFNRLNKRNEAIAKMKEAIKLTEKEKEFYQISLIQMYEEMKLYDEAILELERTKKSIDWDMFNFHNWLGNLYKKKGDYQMAVTQYEEALKIGPPKEYAEKIKKEIVKEVEESLKELKEKIGAKK